MSIPRVDGLSTDSRVLGRHKNTLKFWAINRLKPRDIKRKHFQGKRGIRGQTKDKERWIERDWRRRIPRDRENGFFCISFPDSFDV